jgi:ring-1,2-phenylacetyl-CoA epoxidase subunit PaaC
MTNMALDLIGQATGFLGYAGKLEGKGRSEDDLAYHRDVREYTNRMMVEQPNGDFAVTMMRSFLYSTLAYLQFRELIKSKDETISGLSEKALKEVTYHVRHSSEWIVRMGDGTPESHKKTQDACDDLWLYTNELFEMNEVDEILVREGIACDLSSLRAEWDRMIDEIFAKATLVRPPSTGYQSKGGMKGDHTEHLGFILAEMQSLPRALPDAKW